MTHMLILGAGGFGREILAQTHVDAAYGKDWIVTGFLDGRKDVLKNYSIDIPIVGDPLTYKMQPGEEIILGLSDAKDKKFYSQELLKQNAHFISLCTDIHLSPRVKFGNGCIFASGVHISVDSVLGDMVTVQAGTMIGHDVTIGSYTHIGAQCFIGGGAQIGEGVTIHPNATITVGCKIGDGVTVGAGSVVFGRIPAGITVLGNPAKRFYTSNSKVDRDAE